MGLHFHGADAYDFPEGADCEVCILMDLHLHCVDVCDLPRPTKLVSSWVGAAASTVAGGTAGSAVAGTPVAGIVQQIVQQLVQRRAFLLDRAAASTARGSSSCSS